MTPMLSNGLTTRRIRLAGRSRVVHAPDGDPFLHAFGKGERYRDFARFCRFALEPDDVVVDVGANIGVTSVIMADSIGPRGWLLAVEASPLNGRALERTLAANGVANADVEICAVGAVAATAPFHEASAFGFVMEGTNLLADHATVQVGVRTIDGLVDSAGLARVDMIKLDIEGYEWEALQGAVGTLGQHDPIVFLEFNSWCQIVFYDRNPRAFLDFLLDTFPQLYLWQNGALVSVRDLGRVAFLRRHLLESGCISDLAAAVGSERLDRMARRLSTPLSSGRVMHRLWNKLAMPFATSGRGGDGESG